MAEIPTPTPPSALSAAEDLLQKALGPGLKLNIQGTMPGEMLLTTLINFAMSARAQMPPALRDRLDAVTVQQVEDMQSVWRGLWVKMGVVKAA